VEQLSDDSAKADSILERTDGLLNSGQINKAIRYLDSAYRAFPEAGPIDKWKKYSCLNNLYLNYQLSPARAERYTDSMYLVLKGREYVNATEYAKTLFASGNVFRNQKRYDEAFKRYYEGRKFAKKYLDSCQFSEFTNRLGLIRYAQQKYLKAIPYFKQALKENRHCNADSKFPDRFILPQSIYNNIAFSYEQANLPDSALYYYQEGLAFIERMAPEFEERKAYIETAKGVFYGNLGGQYAELNNFEQAEKYLKESIRLNDRPGYAREDASSAKNKLANMYLQSGHMHEADNLIRQMELDLKKREGKNEEKELTQKLFLLLKSRYHEKTGNWPEAFRYLQQYNSMKDSLNEVAVELRGTDIDVVFKQSEQQYKLEMVSKDNKLKTFYLTGAIVVALMIVSILAIVLYNLKRSRRNVKALKDINDQLQQTLMVLEQSEEDNARMMRVVAHDLRNPIGSITMIASLMLHRSNLAREDMDLLEMMKRSSKDCLDMVDDLLQPKGNDAIFERKPEDLFRILRYCIDQLTLKAGEKRQEIILDASPLIASVNAEKMWRVVSNLINNAIKFSPEATFIEVSLREKTGGAVIAVQDHGIGIPAELRDKIFDMPAEARRKGTSGESTFGLGLAIAKQIVNAHRGTIWFEETPGGGTTFYVELPLSEDN